MVLETERPILVFDLETKYLADEVGGWSHIRDMGMSVAVTYDVQADTYTVYTEADVEALIRDLSLAKLVVGYNILRFDYEVLRGYSFVPLAGSVPTLDLMVPLYQALGFRPRLQDLASATLGMHKLGDGLDAVRWFREGDLEQLVAYCQQDVKATYGIYRHGQEHGFVLVQGRYGIKRVAAGW